MTRTFDGRRIGGVYRHVPMEAKVRVGLPFVVFLLFAVSVPLIVNTAENYLFPMTIGVVGTFYSVLKVIEAIGYYTSEESESNVFQKYVIIRDSLDDFGRSSTLVRWLHDGSHEWLAEHKSKLPSFRFITE